jgi:hypothetical protein
MGGQRKALVPREPSQVRPTPSISQERALCVRSLPEGRGEALSTSGDADLARDPKKDTVHGFAGKFWICQSRSPVPGRGLALAHMDQHTLAVYGRDLQRRASNSDGVLPVATLHTLCHHDPSRQSLRHNA